MSIVVSAENLTALCAEVFERLGSTTDEARRVAVSLVGANLTGHDSHGVIRLPRYANWVRSGEIVPNQRIKLLVDAPVFAVVDGGYGFGQTVAPLSTGRADSLLILQAL
jgi:hydroxycarboxylate dehydrogenase B